jgi:tetratricopeptide (TPR) repeat protein
MKTRIRTATAVIAVLVVGLSAATAGCGRYSLGNLKANRAFKEANDHYRAGQWAEAAAGYEAVIAAGPDYDAMPHLSTAYFFLGHSYENLYRPTRQGEPDNDAYIHKAIENYRLATERSAEPTYRRLAMEYLVAAYGPDKLNDPAEAEPIVLQMIDSDPEEPSAYFHLAQIYENAGRYEEAEEALLKAREARPNDPAVYHAIAGYYNRQGDFEQTMEAFYTAAELEPENPQGYHMIGSFYQDKVAKDFRLTDAQKREYVQRGIEAEDKALSLNPNYIDALVYKNILLRQQANLEKDPKRQQALIKEADQLRDRAIELQKGGAPATQ